MDSDVDEKHTNNEFDYNNSPKDQKHIITASEYETNNMEYLIKVIKKKEVIGVFCTIDELLTKNNVDDVINTIQMYLKNSTQDNEEINDELIQSLVISISESKIDNVKKLLNPVNEQLLNYNVEYNNVKQSNMYYSLMEDQITQLKKLIKEYKRMEKIISMKTTEYSEIKEKCDELGKLRNEQLEQIKQMKHNIIIKEEQLNMQQTEINKQKNDVIHKELLLTEKINDNDIKTLNLQTKTTEYEKYLALFETEKDKFDKSKVYFYDDTLRINDELKLKEKELNDLKEFLVRKQVELDARELDTKKTVKKISSPKIIINPQDSYYSLGHEFETVELSDKVNYKKQREICCYYTSDKCIIL